LAKPILATVGLFVSLGYWNDFVMALWLVDKSKLYPIQYFLYRVLSLITFTRSGKMSTNQAVSMPAESMQMAVFVITLGPIIFVYPYLQKYFVKGIMIGAVKG
jgi:ABC-type glycerol-3-phosphate transport system permease component